MSVHSEEVELVYDESTLDSNTGDEEATARRCHCLEDLFGLNKEWSPWPDKITFALDVLMHLPRSVFSEKQLDLFLWILRVLDVLQVPSVCSMKGFCNNVQKLYGIESIEYQGALGHRYYVNSLSQILAQAVASLFTAHASEFLKPYPDLVQDQVERPDQYRAPSVSKINSLYNPETQTAEPWTFSSEAGNPWREHAAGTRIFAFPIWLYCNDTSAGLPRAELQKEYNVLFLCTSNTAPLLEMLDGIVDQIMEAQEHGIWAWDCHLKEPVLIFPVVLALLGDNPMQSKLSSRIILRGRLFCQACWVEKGRSVFGGAPGGAGDADLDSGESAGAESGESTDNESGSGGEEGSLAPASPGSSVVRESSTVPRSTGLRPPAKSKPAVKTRVKKAKRVVIDSVSTIAHSISNFIRSYIEDAQHVDMKTKISKRWTATGIKDTYQLRFLEQLFGSYKNLCTEKAKTEALKHASASLPHNHKAMVNPVWRVKGLDAHSDTPVELLHVVLLGFVKYFWRDVIKNQLKDKSSKKELLATRLSCLDVSAIAQVAPFVLKDLVTPECYETWKSLSKLIPLLWQPEIQDLGGFLVQLEFEIEQFLLRTARWTGAWFNKPKFRILVHLPDHIRRFGPAILFAAEQFESFNAIIRAKRVHSNRQAPSCDIARAFA
ncbi:hypothetical protein EST38_g11326 [Candolleomyces aberdarensis]|uniref:Uncharacterized protein n=1 Tax=Candolleomyces aberdarensis TaxID=2316362 RepID=A0A4Q2D8E8_9AGAR|nr:hypothetical protein EST38_g11326 [Candolleomyces aberdarensis]